MGYQCGNYLNDPVNVYALGSHGLSILMISKLCSFLILVGYNAKNHFLIRKAEHLASGNVVRGMVLPLYSEYMNMLLVETLVFGIVDIADYDQSAQSHFMITIPVQMAVEQCLQVSLAFFLMNYGSGVGAVRRALKQGAVFAFFTAAVLVTVLGLDTDYPSNFYPSTQSSQARSALAVGLFLCYLVLLLLFYGSLAISPLASLYRRPACIFYARFMTVYTILLFLVVLLMNGTNWDFMSINCSCSMVLFVFGGLLQPMITFKTLQLDSQYWQGLCSDDNNPLKEIWDVIDLETAATMASNMASIEHSKTRRFPLLHFGLIRFEKRMEYVAGGFSRVYFGHIGRNKVALKMLFAIELNPSDVKEFYKEAAVLDVLRHPNVIECLGVCVMPPALVIALEYCKYGSLFEFLYNARPKKKRKPKAAATTADGGGAVVPRETFLGFSMAHSFAPTANPMLTQNQGWGIGTGLGSRQTSMSSFTEEGRLDSCASSVVQMNERGGHGHGHGHGDHDDDIYDVDGSGSSGRRNRNSSMDSVTRASNIVRPQLSTAVNQYLHELEIEYNLERARNPTADLSGGGGASSSSFQQNNSTSSSHNHSASAISTNYSASTNPSASQATGSGSYASNGSPSATTSALLVLVSKLFGLDSKGRYEVGEVNRPSLAGKPAPFNSRAQYLSLEKRLSLVLDALRAVAFLHSRGFMHCDIKSLNFLVTENLTLKLADMGEARAIGSVPKRATPPIPARNWVPPEVLAPDATAESYVPASDVFGLGLVVSEIILLQLPFGDSSLAYTPSNWYTELTTNNVRPPLPVGMDSRLKSTIEGMWCTEPSERISCQEAYDCVEELYSDMLTHVRDAAATATGSRSKSRGDQRDSVDSLDSQGTQSTHHSSSLHQSIATTITTEESLRPSRATISRDSAGIAATSVGIAGAGAGASWLHEDRKSGTDL